MARRPPAGRPKARKEFPAPPRGSAGLLRSLLVLGLLLAAAGPVAAERFPATGGQPTQVIDGAHYLEATAFFGRFGLDASWAIPARRMRYHSAWTTLEVEAEKREVTFNGMRVFMGDAAQLRAGQLWITRLDAEKLFAPLLRPALHQRTARLPRLIAIDAGHGGNDTGTRNTRLKLDEKGFALDVAQRLAALLQREGYEVVMTRADDRFVPLAERAEIANRAGADLFISLHFNSVEKSPQVKGSETYILTPQYQRSTGDAKSGDADRVENVGNRSDPWNAILGYQVQRQLLERLGTVDRGLKRARFAVLRHVECPAVLVEAGYLSNDDEARKIATTGYRDAIAQAVATGIANYAAQVAAARRP